MRFSRSTWHETDTVRERSSAAFLSRLNAQSMAIVGHGKIDTTIPCSLTAAALPLLACIQTGEIVPVGTAFHERTLALCESLNFKRMVRLLHGGRLRNDARARVQRHPQFLRAHRYHPLFKYHVSGRDATKLVNRVISPRHQQSRYRSGHLLLLVRSRRQSN